MSRIGLRPIDIPDGVEAKVEENTVTVKGPKGELKSDMHVDMKIVVEDGKIIVTRPTDQKRHKSLHGLTRSLVANMVEGVTKGYEKSLEMVGVGYRAAKQGNNLVLNVGFSHPVNLEPAPGIEFEVPAATKIVVRGIDKQLVGNTASVIRQTRPPEPYKGKGIKYTDERIRRKVGKTGK